MAAHRKPRQRSLSGNTARTAATIALAGAATATGFDGTGHAEPQLTPTQVKAKVDKLYQEAEVATEKYNGAKEKAEAAETAAGHPAGRGGAQDGEAQLGAGRAGFDGRRAVPRRRHRPRAAARALRRPRPYLDGAEFADRAGNRQAAAVARRTETAPGDRAAARRRAHRADLAEVPAGGAEAAQEDDQRQAGRGPAAAVSAPDCGARAPVGEDGGTRASRSATGHAGRPGRARFRDRPRPPTPVPRRPSPTPTPSSAAPTSGARPAPTPSTARA